MWPSVPKMPALCEHSEAAAISGRRQKPAGCLDPPLPEVAMPCCRLLVQDHAATGVDGGRAKRYRQGSLRFCRLEAVVRREARLWLVGFSADTSDSSKFPERLPIDLQSGRWAGNRASSRCLLSGGCGLLGPRNIYTCHQAPLRHADHASQSPHGCA